jgi:hypothetical protein
MRDLQAGLTRLVEKARTDSAFHELCRHDPAQALREVAAPELPDGCSLRCLEVDERELLITLPEWRSVHDAQELSDAEMDAVAGGTEEAISEVIPFAGDAMPIFRAQAAVALDYTENAIVTEFVPSILPDLAKGGAAIVSGLGVVGAAVTGFFKGW